MRVTSICSTYDPLFSETAWRWHLAAKTCRSWYPIWSGFYDVLLYFNYCM